MSGTEIHSISDRRGFCPEEGLPCILHQVSVLGLTLPDNRTPVQYGADSASMGLFVFSPQACAIAPFIGTVCLVMAHLVMACVAAAYIAMAHVIMTHMIMACIRPPKRFLSQALIVAAHV